MTFRYFQRPHHFSTYTSKARPCGICRKFGPGYEGPFRGAARLEFVCETCLESGRLAEAGGRTNRPAQNDLSRQLRAAHPAHSAEQIASLAGQRTDELEGRTPLIVSWQKLLWPAHCGDYCVFVKEIGRPDLKKLDAKGSGRKFFKTHLHRSQQASTDIDLVWEGIRSDAPQNNDLVYPLSVYLFQCQDCGEHVILWDFD